MKVCAHLNDLFIRVTGSIDAPEVYVMRSSGEKNDTPYECWLNSEDIDKIVTKVVEYQNGL